MANASTLRVLQPFDHTPFLFPAASSPSCAFLETDARRGKASKSRNDEAVGGAAACWGLGGEAEFFACAWHSSAPCEQIPFAFVFRAFGSISGRACGSEQSFLLESFLRLFSILCRKP